MIEGTDSADRLTFPGSMWRFGEIRVSVILLLAAVFALSLLWASFSGDVPDEPTYVSEILELASTGSVSQRSSHPAVVFTWAGVAFVKVLALFGASSLLAVRVLGVLCVVGCGYLAYLAARAAMPERPYAHIAAIGIVTLNPMFMFIGASGNSDTMLNLFAAMLFCGLVLLLRRGFDWTAGLLVVAGLGLGALTKERIWLLAPLIPVALLSRAGISYHWRGLARVMDASNGGAIAGRGARYVGLTAALLVVIAAFFSRSIIDIFLHTPIELGVWFFDELAPTGAVIEWFMQRGALWLASTSWANFGLLDTWAPRWVYRVFHMAILVVVAGLAFHVVMTSVRAWRGGRLRDLLRAPGTHIVLMSALAVIIALWGVAQYELSIGMGSQGRYLFVIALPVTVLVLRGLFGEAPAGRHAVIAAVVLAGMFVVNIYCLLYVAAPAIY